ncbi:dihydropteroate synthase [Shimia gijangensis]|uniref:Dihydropteroate synthase n=1 Tax=Shimia gijangensis TaxID=1470563 RepID=A0A1M6D5G1_9RHOB|nr:dihydropteroate synthase [Shimia gijangensis]SHI68334.1 dihydropteroate synthase [Shimia gijangensis]
MKTYYRAIAQTDVARPEAALSLAGGWTWFSHVEMLTRDAAPKVIEIAEVPKTVLDAITAPRPDFGALSMRIPQIMGILNVTPDSFSDGGQHDNPEQAVDRARHMVQQGATLIDIGGESTRPGAVKVPTEEEIRRTAPVIAALSASLGVPVSIDTRKAPVAKAAIEAGAFLVNDVAGFTFDPDLAPLCATKSVPVCVMHAQGDPATMQDDPHYDDVLLDVYDFLERQIALLTKLGIPQDQIVVDPGIGFGKTIAHNLALLARISLFHSLGCPVLLGASRKGFIRHIGHAPDPNRRIGGSVAIALEGLAQGVQIVRVHDVEDTRQALQLWQAATTGDYFGA